MNIFYILICYLCGSIPFGLIIGKLNGIDVRKHGSGNIGFTNVKRVCGKKVAIPVLILDMLKGFLPVLLLSQNMPSPDYIDIIRPLGGIACVTGHIFPIWLKFKGGKGVATGAAVFLALIPIPMLTGLIIWLILVKVYKYVSLGSIIGSYAVFLTQILLHLYQRDLFTSRELPLAAFALLISIIITVKHRDNICRLLKGEENHF